MIDWCLTPPLTIFQPYRGITRSFFKYFIHLIMEGLNLNKSHFVLFYSRETTKSYHVESSDYSQTYFTDLLYLSNYLYYVTFILKSLHSAFLIKYSGI
jgi:hypothetical protein